VSIETMLFYKALINKNSIALESTNAYIEKNLDVSVVLRKIERYREVL